MAVTLAGELTESNVSITRGPLQERILPVFVQIIKWKL
jgi:hypothetical protein